MKLTGLVQVAILLLIIALAASCEVSKEYANKVFKPAIPQKKSDTTMAFRFMQFDSDSGVDSIDLKDFAGKQTTGIDKPEKPASSKDSTKTEVVISEAKKPLIEKPVDATKNGSTRTKRVRQ